MGWKCHHKLSKQHSSLPPRATGGVIAHCSMKIKYERKTYKRGTQGTKSHNHIFQIWEKRVESTGEKPQMFLTDNGASLHSKEQQNREPKAEAQQQNAAHSRGSVVRRVEAPQAEVQGQVPHPLHRWGVAQKHCGRTES